MADQAKAGWSACKTDRAIPLVLKARDPVLRVIPQRRVFFFGGLRGWTAVRPYAVAMGRAPFIAAKGAAKFSLLL
jgi:hypothetical protein